MPPKKSKPKTIKYNGRTYKYKTPKDLARKLRMTKKDAQFIIRNQGRELTATTDTGEIVRFSIKDKPLLVAELGDRPPSINEIVRSASTGKAIDEGALKITKGLPDDVIIRFIVEISYSVIVSENIISKTLYRVYNTTRDNLLLDILNDVRTYIGPLPVDPEQVIGDIADDILNNMYTPYGRVNKTGVGLHDLQINNIGTRTTFNYIDGVLRGDITDITNIFGDNILPFKYTENCVRDYLRSIHNKSKKLIDNLGDKNGVSIKQLTDYSIARGCSCYIVDINKNIIVDTEGKNKNKYKAINGVAYNNHFYPLKKRIHKKEREQKKPYDNFKLIDNVNDVFLNTVAKRAIDPEHIRLKEGNITSFIDNRTLYIENADYEICEDILRKLGMEDKMTPFITINSVAHIIEEKYKNEDVNSFLPHDIPKASILYRNDDIINTYDNDEFITIDENAQYLDKLRNLPYLISTDFMSDNVNLFITDINPNYLYIAEPTVYSVLIPNTNLYWGAYLIRCKKEGLKFTLKEELETTTHKNYLQPMIDDLIKLIGLKLTNKIIRVFIGRFESHAIYPIHNVVKVCNDDEASRTNNTVLKFKDDINMVITTENYYRPFNRKPIAIQIKDNAKWSTYEMMKKLKLRDENIVQIKVDSITINKKGLTIEPAPYEAGNWKREATFKPINGTITRYNDPTISLLKPMKNNNTVKPVYAGAGKTYEIINNIIPTKKEYIVLTPSHSTLQEYKHAGLNSNVIQKYTYANTIPDEQTIIIDELGLIDRDGNILIYKCFLMGKEIIAYGDFNQQLPYAVNKPFNNPYYLSWIYNKIDTDYTNHRNEFTTEYYDDLIDGNIDVVEEVHKYDTDEPEFYIAYRNLTTDKTNQEIMEKKGFTNLHDVGMRLACFDNRASKYDIYNQFILDVVENDGVNVILADKVRKYTVPIGVIKRFFKAGFCINTYSAQGRTLESYKFIKDDDEYLKSAGVAYTVISRIKKRAKI